MMTLDTRMKSDAEYFKQDEKKSGSIEISNVDEKANPQGPNASLTQDNLNKVVGNVKYPKGPQSHQGFDEDREDDLYEGVP